MYDWPWEMPDMEVEEPSCQVCHITAACPTLDLHAVGDKLYCDRHVQAALDEAEAKAKRDRDAKVFSR